MSDLYGQCISPPHLLNLPFASSVQEPSLRLIKCQNIDHKAQSNNLRSSKTIDQITLKQQNGIVDSGLNEIFQQINSPSTPSINTSELVTRQEVTQMISQVANYYENRICALESVVSQLVTELQQFRNQSLSITTGDQQLLFNPSGQNMSQIDVFSPLEQSCSSKTLTQTNSLAFLNQVGNLKNSKFLMTQQTAIQDSDDTSQLLSKQMSQASIPAGPQTLREKEPFSEINLAKMQNNSYQLQTQVKQNLLIKYAEGCSSGKDGSNQKLQTEIQEDIKITLDDQTFRTKQRKLSRAQNNQNSSQKSSVYQNYSDIKNKISMFSMQQLNSPSNLNSAQKENIESEDKRFISSPESSRDRDSCNRSKLRIKSKASNQIEEIKTKKNEQENKSSKDKMTEVQQKIQNFRVKSAEKMAAQPKVTNAQKSQNMSLSILLEEDSNSQQILSGMSDKLAASLTYDGRSNILQDQRHFVANSVKSQQKSFAQIYTSASQMMKPILEKQQSQQRSSASLHSKTSQASLHQNSQNQSIVSYTQNQVSAKNYSGKSNINQTQNYIKSKTAASQDNQKQVQIIQKSQKMNEQEKLKRQVNGHQKYVKGNKSFMLQNQDKSLNVSQDRKRSSQNQNQATGFPQKKKFSSHNVSKHHQVTKGNQKFSEINHDTSLSQLIQPVFQSERHFKVKTPLGYGGVRSQTPNLASQFPDLSELQSMNENQNAQKEAKWVKNDIRKSFQSVQIDNSFSAGQDFNTKSSTLDQRTNISQDQQAQIQVRNSQKNQKRNQENNLDKKSQEASRSKNLEKGTDKIDLLVNCLEYNDRKQNLQGSMSQRCLTLNSFNDQTITHESLSGTQNISDKQKKKISSRLHGSKAGSRLNNLVQTIQKYKDEQIVKQDSFTSVIQSSNQPVGQNLPKAVSKESASLLKQYSNFESSTDQESSAATHGHNLATEENQIQQKKLQAVNPTQHYVKVKSKRMSKDHSYTSAIEVKDTQIEKPIVLDEVAIDRQEPAYSGSIQLSNDNQIDFKNSFDSNKSEEQNLIFGTYSQSSNFGGFASETQPAPQHNSTQSVTKKSRNFTNYQEYFSFSNMDREQQQHSDDKIETNYHSQKHDIRDQRLENYDSAQKTEASNIDLLKQLEEEYQTQREVEAHGFGFANEEYENKDYLDKFNQGEENYSTGLLAVGSFTTRRMERNATMVRITTFAQQSNSSNEFLQLKETSQEEEIVKFDSLTGDVLDLISEYLPSTEFQMTPPPFVLANSKLLKSFGTYKYENLSIQNEILVDQIAELKKELFDYFDQKLFKMSKGLSIIYQSNINSKEWVQLQELAESNKLLNEDIVLLRVYILLLGSKPKQQNAEFLEQFSSLILKNKTRLNQIFNPELHFTFGPQILCQVGSLLQTFSLENYILHYNKTDKSGQLCSSRKIRTLQILAQIIYEALQFCKIVPNRIESDIRELERAIELYSLYQNKLQAIMRS